MSEPEGWSPQGEPKHLWSALGSHPAHQEQGSCLDMPLPWTCLFPPGCEE